MRMGRWSRLKEGNMICDNCKIEMKKKTATNDAPYRYALSGLKNVFLVGIEIEVCERCSDVSPTIPRIGELHDVIAKDLIKKPKPLTGNELRFLRKHADLPANKFSALLLMSPEHLSRIENSATQSLGPQADKLARAIITIRRDGGNETKEILLRTADMLIEKVSAKQVIKLEGDRWKKAA